MDPIRCFTCGKVIGHKWEKYREYLQQYTVEQSLDKLGMVRQCCRRMFLTNVNVKDKILDFNRVLQQNTDRETYITNKQTTVSPSQRRYIVR
jgi:DNA-directed RNA polymerase I, II, and III subunit RPABC5